MPLLLPLLPLPLLLLPLLLPLLATAAHLPLSHDLEQQSPKLVHVPPVAAHVAVGPPHTFFIQSFLQQSVSALHAVPSAPQLGVTHVPLEQLPLQQSPDDWHDSPTWLHEFGLDVPCTQTPEQARLQQSE
jgi:hypothetical protein